MKGNPPKTRKSKPALTPNQRQLTSIRCSTPVTELIHQRRTAETTAVQHSRRRVGMGVWCERVLFGES